MKTSEFEACRLIAVFNGNHKAAIKCVKEIIKILHVMDIAQYNFYNDVLKELQK